jgi:hypothetical protein
VNDQHRLLCTHLLIALVMSSACGGGGTPAVPVDGGESDANTLDAPADGEASLPDAGDPPGPVDPFDPGSMCTDSIVESERLPGSMLLLLDSSRGMANPLVGFVGNSAWLVTTQILVEELSTFPDSLNMGLMFYSEPVAELCDVTSTAHVGVGPLTTTLDQIVASIEARELAGDSNVVAATRAAWSHMRSLDAPGRKAVVLFARQYDSCDNAYASELDLHEAAASSLEDGVETYAIGLAANTSKLSGLAFHGGTARTERCVADCVADGRECRFDSECTGGSTCEPWSSFSYCRGGRDAECCHYDTPGSNEAEAELRNALRDVVARFTRSCVYGLPASVTSPDEINVGVTLPGQERRLLRRGSDDAVDSWDYTSDARDAIVVNGPACERLLSGDGVVEIATGCTTVSL